MCYTRARCMVSGEQRCARLRSARPTACQLPANCCSVAARLRCLPWQALAAGRHHGRVEVFGEQVAPGRHPLHPPLGAGAPGGEGGEGGRPGGSSVFGGGGSVRRVACCGVSSVDGQQAAAGVFHRGALWRIPGAHLEGWQSKGEGEGRGRWAGGRVRGCDGARQLRRASLQAAKQQQAAAGSCPAPAAAPAAAAAAAQKPASVAVSGRLQSTTTQSGVDILPQHKRSCQPSSPC